jgi:hypothetical protein
MIRAGFEQIRADSKARISGKVQAKQYCKAGTSYRMDGTVGVQYTVKKGLRFLRPQPECH